MNQGNTGAKELEQPAWMNVGGGSSGGIERPVWQTGAEVDSTNIHELSERLEIDEPEVGMMDETRLRKLFDDVEDSYRKKGAYEGNPMFGAWVAVNDYLTIRNAFLSKIEPLSRTQAVNNEIDLFERVWSPEFHRNLKDGKLLERRPVLEVVRR